MKKRKIKRIVSGMRAIDGAGVHLVRVLKDDTVKDFDPFLMLDSFDSKNPDDYIAGFPFHPHRGIETVTYLIEGEIDHKDSLGNSGIIHSGESQWMTAGRGIIHQEMPQAAKRMLGLQLWINLKSSDKMTKPSYFDIKSDMIGKKEDLKKTIRVIAGEYDGVKGVTPPYENVTIIDFELKANSETEIKTKKDDNVFIFLVSGNASVDEIMIKEKSAVLFCMEGDFIKVAGKDKDLRFIYFSGRKIDEPVAWGGPIVMNTRKELMQAYRELDEGTFIRSDGK